MVDRLRAGHLGYRGNGCERDELAAARAQEYFREVFGVPLKRRADLQDHRIIIARRVDGRDLPRSEGIVKRAAYLFGRDAEGCRLLAVDVDDRLRVLDLQI